MLRWFNALDTPDAKPKAKIYSHNLGVVHISSFFLYLFFCILKHKLRFARILKTRYTAKLIKYPTPLQLLCHRTLSTKFFFYGALRMLLAEEIRLRRISWCHIQTHICYWDQQTSVNGVLQTLQRRTHRRTQPSRIFDKFFFFQKPALKLERIPFIFFFVETSELFNHSSTSGLLNWDAIKFFTQVNSSCNMGVRDNPKFTTKFTTMEKKKKIFALHTWIKYQINVFP
jgi:hypothetical protein